MSPPPSDLRGTSSIILDEFQLPSDPAARRLRERYIAARYLQFPNPAQTLKNTNNVLRWAQELLDDDQPRQAAELLQMALEESPKQKPLWLFLIELAYVGGDVGGFVELSDAFRKRFADAEELAVMDELGKRLLPADPRFAHAEAAIVAPGWTTPDSGLRDALRQRKLHQSLVEAITFHLSRP
jgi:hypothetical protein